MKKTNKFSPEVRERAVRMVQEHHAHIDALKQPVQLARLAAAPRAAYGTTKR